ncbi:hypothetical protein Peur_036253 [Populus x canadensis]
MLSWCNIALTASRAVARLSYAPLASLQTFLVSGVVFLLGILLILTLVRAKDRKWTKFDTKVPAVPSYTGLQGQLGCARTTTKKLPMRL